jgi:uncharacterized membrane protein
MSEKNNRPSIKIHLTLFDKALELVGLILFIGIWILTFMNYDELPDIIPIHYNGLGEVDRYGEKSTILALPIVASVIFIGLTILNRFPHIFNYPIEITEQNALRNYRLATRLLRILKVIICLVFGMIILSTLNNIKGEQDGLVSWFLPIVLILFFIPTIYYLIKIVKKE